jgi:signal transduction histidine kinase
MSETPDPRPLIDATDQIEREQLRASYGTWIRYFDGLPFAVCFTLLMSGAFPAIGDTGFLASVTWLASRVLWSLGAYAAFTFYQHHEAEHAPRFWTRLQMAIRATDALFWTWFMWVFWQPGNYANQAILCGTMVGVIAATFMSQTANRQALMAALGVYAVGVLAVLLSYDGPVAQVFVIVFPLFMALLFSYAVDTTAKFADLLKLRFENEALVAQVTRANKAKSDFLASMSHELRTPLNAIIGYADIMRQGTFGPISHPRYGEYVGHIADSGQHLLKMINDLLDLAKIEAGGREIHATPIRLSEVAAEAIRYVEPQANRAHVSIMLDVKRDSIVRADERATTQMVINLLSNAVKFSNPGGLAVVFCDILPGERCQLGVKDTGVGMTVEMQRKALEPFTQASDKMTVEGRGTGLGLPIIKGLIEAHQGQLRIESSAGIGSKIWVEFPPERLMRRTEVAA